MKRKIRNVSKDGLRNYYQEGDVYVAGKLSKNEWFAIFSTMFILSYLAFSFLFLNQPFGLIEIMFIIFGVIIGILSLKILVFLYFKLTNKKFAKELPIVFGYLCLAVFTMFVYRLHINNTWQDLFPSILFITGFGGVFLIRNTLLKLKNWDGYVGPSPVQVISYTLKNNLEKMSLADNYRATMQRHRKDEIQRQRNIDKIISNMAQDTRPNRIYQSTANAPTKGTVHTEIKKEDSNRPKKKQKWIFQEFK